MAPSGALTLTSTQVAEGAFRASFGKDRFVTQSSGAGGRMDVYERSGFDWNLAYALSGAPFAPSIFYGDRFVLDGQRLFVSDPANSEVDVFDLSTSGAALLIDEIALPAGKIVNSMAMDGDTFVAHIGLPLLDGIEGGEIVVYSDLGAGFSYLSNVPTGPEFEFGDFGVNVAIEGNTIAVGFPAGTATSSCGRVLLFSRLSSIVYQTGEIVEGGACSVTPLNGTGFGRDVEFRNSAHILISGGGQKGARQYRDSGNGWVPFSRHLSDTPGFRYAFARDWVVGLAPEGLQVFDNVSSIANEATVCGATLGSTFSEWQLFYDGSYSLADSGGTFQVNYKSGSVFSGNAIDAPALFLVGSERGSTMLGVSANICVGGQVRRSPMPSVVSGSVVDGAFEFDPGDYGITAGDTVFFQSWRREPGIAGGATTSALAITFIPPSVRIFVAWILERARA